MKKCLDCKKEKDLTVHGTCWKCHISSLRIGNIPLKPKVKKWDPEKQKMVELPKFE